jgi:hypothetical protein
VRRAIAGLVGLLTFITIIKHLPAVFEVLEDLVNVTPDNLNSVATILGVALVISRYLFVCPCGRVGSRCCWRIRVCIWHLSCNRL